MLWAVNSLAINQNNKLIKRGNVKLEKIIVMQKDRQALKRVEEEDKN